MTSIDKFRNIDEVEKRIMNIGFKICYVGEIGNEFWWIKE
jgi:hypothetical protein